MPNLTLVHSANLCTGCKHYRRASPQKGKDVPLHGCARDQYQELSLVDGKVYTQGKLRDCEVERKAQLIKGVCGAPAQYFEDKSNG